MWFLSWYTENAKKSRKKSQGIKQTLNTVLSDIIILFLITEVILLGLDSVSFVHVSCVIFLPSLFKFFSELSFSLHSKHKYSACIQNTFLNIYLNKGRRCRLSKVGFLTTTIQYKLTSSVYILSNFNMHFCFLNWDLQCWQFHRFFAALNCSFFQIQLWWA